MPLTYRSDSDIRGAASTDRCEAGAPEDEIEVTAEMIEAGSREMENYYLGDGRYCIQDDGLAAIYVAMVRASRS
jgi:hypothetical protein